MKNLSTTTSVAIQLLETAISVMEKETPFQNDKENNILSLLRTAHNEIFDVLNDQQAANTDSKVINIYTDGACKGNPGPGGFGVVIEKNGDRKEYSKGYRHTTNNRMELMAVLFALHTLIENGDAKSGGKIVITSDSKYVTNAFQMKWIEKWKKNDYSNIQNPDLWKLVCEKTDKLTEMGVSLDFVWIKGHAGHPQNERCDRLAVEASTSDRLLVDKKYESLNS